jgi:hypothetical protein
VNIGAIVVINDWPSCAGSIDVVQEQRGPSSRGPISCADLLGQSVLDRTVERIQRAGIQTVSVIGGSTLPALPFDRKIEMVVAGSSFERWAAAQRRVLRQHSQGIETVVIIGLNAYMEFDLASAIDFHRFRGGALTQLEDGDGALDCWIVDTHWFVNAATGCALPFRYGEFPGLPIPNRMNGYVKRLAEASDLRELVADAFLSRCEIRPRGREVRPGVWINDGARIHKSARLVAPVYVGGATKIGACAIVTRFSNIERHCRIGEGTLIDATSVLPHTVLGSNLDVSRAVVDGDTFIDLERRVAVRIEDSNWVCDVSPLMSPHFHGRRSSQSDARAGALAFQYSQYLSRAAGILSEVLFKG